MFTAALRKFSPPEGKPNKKGAACAAPDLFK